MSVIEKVGEFLNTLTMQYELRYKWWKNAVVMILSVPHCLCWLFYFQNIITFLFEKLSCAVEILVWSDADDFLTKLLGMPYSVITPQQACSTEMVLRVWGKNFSSGQMTRPLFCTMRNYFQKLMYTKTPCTRSSFDYRTLSLVFWLLKLWI